MYKKKIDKSTNIVDSFHIAISLSTYQVNKKVIEAKEKLIT